jgi:hypothetical protein
MNLGYSICQSNTDPSLARATDFPSKNEHPCTAMNTESRHKLFWIAHNVLRIMVPPLDYFGIEIAPWHLPSVFVSLPLSGEKQ